MKLSGLGLSAGGGTRSVPSRGLFSAAPLATVHPVMASQPGAYGGPPGSFITSGRGCPPGYMASPLSHGETRCIPRVVASAPTPAPAPPRQAPAPSIRMPPITVSPVMQQSFTPQFSPVMQMAQDSPGMTQAAAPEQVAAPKQAAQTIAPSPASFTTPPSAPLPMAAPVDYGPPPPSAPSFDTPPSAPQSMPATFSDWPVAPEVREAIEAEKGKGGMIPWLIGAAGLGLFLFTRNTQGKQK